jgi:hypothetical protein
MSEPDLQSNPHKGACLTLAAFVGNGLNVALGRRLPPPHACAYLDTVKWSYTPADNSSALFGDIGVLIGRRCQIDLSLARTTRTLLFVGLDVRTLTGFTRSQPVRPHQGRCDSRVAW